MFLFIPTHISNTFTIFIFLLPYTFIISITISKQFTVRLIDAEKNELYIYMDTNEEKYPSSHPGAQYIIYKLYVCIYFVCKYNVCMYIHGENVSNNNNPDSRGFNTYLDIYPHIIIAEIWDIRLRILSNGTCFYAIIFLVNGLYNIIL